MSKALALTLLISGCAPHLALSHLPATPMAAVSPAEHPDDPAVIRLHDEKVLFYAGPDANPFGELQVHEVVQILSEEGFRFAAVRIPLRDKDELIGLEARTIGADGVTQTLASKDILANDDRSSREDDVTWHSVIFRFPRVSVGSRLEYTYTVRQVPMRWSMGKAIAGELPVDHYRLEIQCADAVRYALKAYRSGAQFRTTQHGDMSTVVLEAEHLAGRRDEPMLPHWQMDGPFWLFRVQQFWLRRVFSASEDWPHALKSLGEGLFVSTRKLFGGVDLSVDRTRCSTKRCLIDRALTLSRERLEYIGTNDEFRPRKLKELVANGTGNDDDKTLLLLHLLREAGLSPRIAFTERSLGQLLDPDFPARVQLSHSLVFVPEQAGLAATWIDPICDSCAAGELPRSLLGASALVTWVEPRILDGDITHADFLRVEGSPAPSGRLTARYDASLTASGDAAVKAGFIFIGDSAEQGRLFHREFTPERWQREAQAMVTARGAGGVVEAAPPSTFDRSSGTATRALTFTLPGLATIDRSAGSERLVVPLSILRTTWDDRLPHRPRRRDLYIPRDEEIDETLELAIPEGYEVARLPPPSASSTAPSVRFELAVKAEGRRVIAHRTLNVAGGLYHAAEYKGIQQSLADFTALRRATIVLRKSSAAVSAAANEP